MSASDAVILLVADGLVAVGRVLGRFRRPCVAERRAGLVGDADRLTDAEESRDSWEPDELWAAKSMAAENQRAVQALKYALKWPEPHIPVDEVRSAAVSRPAADNTTQADHLEAAWNYHQPAVAWQKGATALVWFCEGCSWSGSTKQAHARHRFQVLADMSAATGRVNEQLGGGA